MTRDDPMWWYIGSTIHSPLFREQSRIRKYAQLEKGTDAFFEPALRIWIAKKNFFSFFVTPIRPEDPEIEKNQSSSIFQYRSPGRLIYWFIGFLYWFFFNMVLIFWIDFFNFFSILY